jgi:5-methylcytosine-specific restriction enzyme B
VARAHRPDDAPLYELAAEWVERCLAGDRSLFDETRERLWTLSNFERIREIFTEQPDESSDPFLVKLGRQLAGASDDLVLLFGEVLYVHLLIANDIGGAAKRDNVTAVLSHMKEGVKLPDRLDERLEHGLVNTGVAYKTYRPQQLWLFIDVVIALKSRSPEERRVALEDPWRFRELVHQVPHEAAFTQRNALLHLVHPDTFEDCVSRDYKQQFVDAYGHLATNTDDLDRALLEIRDALESAASEPVDLYREPYRSQWSRERLRAWDVLSAVAPVVTGWGQYDAEERIYKLELAEQLRAVYEGERGVGWSVDVVRVINRTNLVNFRPLGRLRNWGKEHPEQLDAAVAALVDADQPIAALDAFAADVGEVLSTRGARLSVGAVMLFGLDPSSYAPWRAQATASYTRLLGYGLPTDGSDSEHYGAYLEMLDVVREELQRRGVDLRDRLDAQALLWVVAGKDLEAEPFVSLKASTSRKLAAWRGDERLINDEDERGGGSSLENRWRADRIRQISEAAAGLEEDKAGASAPSQEDRQAYAVEALRQLRERGNLDAFVADYRESDQALEHTPKGAHQTFLSTLVRRADDADEAARVLAAGLSAPASADQIGEHLEPLVELAQRTGTPHAPAAGMVPLVASAFWSLQDAQWLPLYRTAENALSWWGWLPSSSEATERYRGYLDALGDRETVEAFRRVGNGWFPGLDPTLVERLALNREQANDEDVASDRTRNLEHVRADLKVLDRCIVAALTRQLGQPLETVTSALEGRSESDAFIAWRLRNSVANPPPDVRVWITSDGIAIGAHPGGGRDRLAESFEIAQQRRPADVELFAVTSDERGHRSFERVEQLAAGADLLVGRWYPGSTALGRSDLVDDLTALVTRLKPLFGAWLADLGAGSIPITGQSDDALAQHVKRFVRERSYPSLKERQQIEARADLRQVLTPEGLDSYDLDGIRRVVNSSAGGGAGPQAVLNTTLRDASAEELDGFFEAVRYLLWDGDEPEAVRIDRLLDKADLGLPGLGESVVVKLLATAHPDRWVPAFPLRGPMGKVRLLEALGLPHELVGTVGEQQVTANNSIRDRLEPHFPGDTWGMKNFAYWLASQEEVVETTAGVDLIEKAATDLHVSADFLREVVELLREKKQIILYGPPGTGKTYLARRLARALVNDDETRYRLVQFHPSYSYEDFFEGYRPDVDGDGQLTYQLQQGPFAQMVEAAEASPAAEHVMIIDEINRANLPKVFGELLFLLEYRDEPAYTQYRPSEPFTVPQKLYLIGTMNTADRSIALVDAALRRRFHFVGFFPHEGEVAGLLRRWLEARDGPTWVADLLDQVNDELRRDLGGPHLQIGPSYFMVDGLDRTKLERIWRYSIHPYIEEQLFGQQDRIDRYRFEAVWSRFQPDPSGIPGEGDEEP